MADPSPLPATQDASPAHTPSYKRITQEQIRAILQLSRLGKTQVQISQALGCHQTTVGRVLADFTDSRDEATAYLRAQALPMAQNVVRKGKPDVQLKALQGLGVIGDAEAGPKVVIQIGGDANDVQIAIQPTFACSTQALTGDSHSVTDATGSDN